MTQLAKAHGEPKAGAQLAKAHGKHMVDTWAYVLTKRLKQS